MIHDKRPNSMPFSQYKIKLQARSRGCYLVTDELVRPLTDLKEYKVGMANFFIQHSSAALTLNENFDPDVRHDMTNALNRMVPDQPADFYVHADEGPDDMPGHVKLLVVGVSLNIPILNGRLALGTWQGLWLCEFRDYQHVRSVVVTLHGEK